MEIRITNLVKTYGKYKALDDINLTIAGGMFGLLGPNGAGKTTLMRIMATLLPPTSGNIRIGQRDITDRQEIRRLLGYLPQEFSFYPQLSVFEVMDYLAMLSGIQDKKLRHARTTQLLEQVNLWQHRKTKTNALSGGMKRRLGIAQALINDPELLIVDEPTAGLDPEERVRFRNLLSDFAVNRTVILSTHIVGDIEFACENLAVLNSGKLIFAGKVRELLTQARGSVWTALINKEQLALAREKFKVISYVPENNTINLRLLSPNKPFADAQPVEPSIEDAYMALMGGGTTQ